MADRARTILNQYNAVDIKQRANDWRGRGWRGYDPKARPLTSEEVAKERSYYMADADEADWRQHYQTYYGTAAYEYDYYRPAYQFGSSLRDDMKYRDWDWSRLEAEARKTWTKRYPDSPWEDIKGAVRHGWERVKEAVRGY
jgi:hypothetical protein